MSKFLGAIPAMQARVMRRKQRTERKNFLRFLREHSNPSTHAGRVCMGAAERVVAIRLRPDWTGEFKILKFGRVLDVYAAAVTQGARPIEDEAAPASSA